MIYDMKLSIEDDGGTTKSISKYFVSDADAEDIVASYVSGKVVILRFIDDLAVPSHPYIHYYATVYGCDPSIFALRLDPYVSENIADIFGMYVDDNGKFAAEAFVQPYEPFPGAPPVDENPGGGAIEK